MKRFSKAPVKVFLLYSDGFRNMPDWGKKLWVIILLKLFIMFAVLKIFFFPDIMKKNFDNAQKRSEYIIDQLVKEPANNDGEY